MTELTTTEPIRVYDPVAREWHAVTVPAEASRPTRDRRRRRTVGAPRVTAGLSDGAPLESWWRDTAYAPANGPAGWADMRRHVAPSAMRGARRPATVYPGDH
jgi:hypothetical protein